MTWKGLGIGSATGGNDSTRRHSAISSETPLRHSEHVPRPTPAEGQLGPPRLSEATPRSNVAGQSNGGTTSTHDESPIPQRKQNRFSLMRFRHASDPQLSKSFTESKPPPVPAVPPPPKIITTSPTANQIERPQKRKTKFNLLSRSQKPSRENLVTETLEKSSTDNNGAGRSNQAPQVSQSVGPSFRASHISFEEPGRLSTNSVRSGTRGHAEESNTSNASPVTRLSESSRSDGSSGDRGNDNSISKNGGPSSHFFRLPRLKKSRASLFPLPVKIPPPDSSGQDTSRVSPNVKSQSSPAKQSPLSKPAPLSAAQLNEANSSEDHLQPLPSPSRSSLGLASGTGLSRNDSTTSAHSTKSSPAQKQGARGGGRGRSSTINSLAEVPDDHPQTSSPSLLASGRTSTSTNGRKSFGDLFGLSHRLRHDSEPPLPRNGSPSVGGPGTPASDPSKSNSFSLARELTSYPEREEGDTAATYLSRLEGAVHRGAIATILSQSSDDFFRTTLRRYMRGFSFFGDPMDMAIRKLLMEAELPKETQQIDRVIQAFADRYHECNPGIFASTDQAYFIAFSILILHTDVFNKNNKRKMQKQDYIKNTQGEGIAEDILECFYDNISYTPFIHVEDEINLNTRQFAPKLRTNLFKAASSNHLSKSTKGPIDPYALILDGNLGSLRPSLKGVMDLDDTYSSTGVDSPLDINKLHRAFYKSGVLQIVSARSRPDAFMNQSTIVNPAESHPGLVDIKIAKVGLLWRKDPKKKKTRSPWQEWGAVLSASQLYFFRDVSWVKSLISQYESHQKVSRGQPVVFKPPLTEFKPDVMMSTDDAVALIDSSYKRHKHAFLFVRHGGLEETFLANSDAEMNEWLSKLNYAAAFRTTGVRMRGMIGANNEGQRGRDPGSTDSNESESSASASTEPANPGLDPQLEEEVFAARRQLMAQRIREANRRLFSSQKQLDDILRNARHLQVLTPIQPRARENVILAAGRMSAKIKWVRLDIWRTKCHREILALDLGDEETVRSESLVRQESLSVPGVSVSIPNQNALAKLETNTSAIPASPSSYRSNQTDQPTAAVEQGTPDKLDGPIHSPEQRRGSMQMSLASSELTQAATEMSLGESISNAPQVGPLSLPSDRDASTSRTDTTSVRSRPSRRPSSAISVEDNEEQLLRDAGLLSPDDANQRDATSMLDPEKQTEAKLGEPRSKVRRSLHRTLRDSHISPHHQRSKKGKDSGSSVPSVDELQPKTEKEGLARGTGSFTVHGKKASVITFGSEWQNMSPEQRLKMRKPAQADDSRASEPYVGDDVSDTTGPGQARSARSGSTTTVKSLKSQKHVDDPAGSRRESSPLGDIKEKHLQTIRSHDESVEGSAVSSNEASEPAKSPNPESKDTLDAPEDRDLTRSESETIPGNENPLNHAVSEQSMRHSPQEQAVNA